MELHRHVQTHLFKLANTYTFTHFYRERYNADKMIAIKNNTDTHLNMQGRNVQKTKTNKHTMQSSTRHFPYLMHTAQPPSTHNPNPHAHTRTHIHTFIFCTLTSCPPSVFSQVPGALQGISPQNNEAWTRLVLHMLSSLADIQYL